MAKSSSAFRTISEVAGELDLPQHVLRFWESKFNAIKPMKRGGGRRYYRPEDIEVLRRIRNLLYNDGYTIKGVQKLFREGGKVAARTENGGSETLNIASGNNVKIRQELKAILGELEDLRELVRG